MRKATAVWTVCLAASFVFAATVLLAQTQSKRSAPNASATHTDATAINAITPLNMKTGLWQTTMTGKVTGLPPQLAAAVNPTSTHKSCVTPEQLTRSQWTKGLTKCSSVTVLKSTGTDIDVEMKGCGKMMAEGHGKFHLADPGHLTGSVDMTMILNGNTPFGGNGPIHSHTDFTSIWIGATCPADMN